jgi:hypothetical protein
MGFEFRAYTLSHSTSPFCDGFLQDRVSQTICLAWFWTTILLISASWVGGITGMSSRHPAWLLILKGQEQRELLPLTESLHSGKLLKSVYRKPHSMLQRHVSVMFIQMSNYQLSPCPPQSLLVFPATVGYYYIDLRKWKLTLTLGMQTRCPWT